MIPPTAAPTVNKDRASQPSRPAALGELLEEPAALEPEPEGEDEVGFDPPDVGEGVKTPPDGSWARQDDAAEAASSAVLGPAHGQHKHAINGNLSGTHESDSKWRCPRNHN
jgi:hypothetical protein